MREFLNSGREARECDSEQLSAPESSLTRRELVGRGARLGVGLSVGAGLAGSGGMVERALGAPLMSDAKGTAVMINYLGWMGKGQVETFARLNPEANIKQVPSAGALGNLQLIQNNRRAYDFWFTDQPYAQRALVAGLLQKPNWKKIPNIKYVDARFRQAFPLGVPTDWGKTGIGYRADLVGDEITSWSDLFDLAPKYSKQILMFDGGSTIIGSMLKMLGYSGNSGNPDQLKRALRKLLRIKPHLQAIQRYGLGKALVKGTAAIAITGDQDVVYAQQENPNIKWVAPSEGLMGYVEGWLTVKGARHLDVVEAFMNYSLRPKIYANFVNTTFTAYCETAATPLIKKAITGSPVLQYDARQLKRVEFEQFKGAATTLWDQTWDQFKSS